MSTTIVQYRKIAKHVIRWYLELEGGCLRVPIYGDIFDVGLLDFRLDVEGLFKQMRPWDRDVLLLIARDGLTAAQACAKARVPGCTSPLFRCDAYVRQLEARFGRMCLDNHVEDVLSYTTKLI